MARKIKTKTRDNAAESTGASVQVASAPRRTRRMARRNERTMEAEGTEETIEAPAANTSAEQPASIRPPASTPRPASKIAAVIALLERSEGATLAELVEATGWLPHTTRAALTGLKKKGRTIAKDKRDDVTCYRIGAAA